MSLVEQTILLPADDVAAAVETMKQRDDIAAVILEDRARRGHGAAA